MPRPTLIGRTTSDVDDCEEVALDPCSDGLTGPPDDCGTAAIDRGGGGLWADLREDLCGDTDLLRQAHEQHTAGMVSNLPVACVPAVRLPTAAVPAVPAVPAKSPRCVHPRKTPGAPRPPRTCTPLGAPALAPYAGADASLGSAHTPRGSENLDLYFVVHSQTRWMIDANNPTLAIETYNRHLGIALDGHAGDPATGLGAIRVHEDGQHYRVVAMPPALFRAANPPARFINPAAGRAAASR